MRTFALLVTSLVACGRPSVDRGAPDADLAGDAAKADVAMSAAVLWVEWGNRAGVIPADYVFGTPIEATLPADPSLELSAFGVASDRLVYVARSLTDELDIGVVAGAHAQTWLTAQPGPGMAALSPDAAAMAIARSGDDVELVRDGAMTSLSPAIANGAASLASLAWSPDGRYVAFAGDFTTPGVNELHVVDVWGLPPGGSAAEARRGSVDTSAPTPSAAMSPTGVVGATAFGSDDAVYACASDGRLYRFEAASATGTEVALPARDDGSAPACGALASDPTGAHVLVVADTPIATAGELYSIDVATGAITRLTTGSMPGRAPRGPFVFSHAGDRVAFAANFDHANVSAPYVAALSGSAHRVLDLQQPAAGAATTSFAWSLDDRTMWLAATPDLGSVPPMLYWLDPARTDNDEPYLIFAPVEGVQAVVVVASP